MTTPAPCHNCGRAPCDQECPPPRPIVHRRITWPPMSAPDYMGIVCGAPGNAPSSSLSSGYDCPDCWIHVRTAQARAALANLVQYLESDAASPDPSAGNVETLGPVRIPAAVRQMLAQAAGDWQTAEDYYRSTGNLIP